MNSMHTTDMAHAPSHYIPGLVRQCSDGGCSFVAKNVELCFREDYGRLRSNSIRICILKDQAADKRFRFETFSVAHIENRTKQSCSMHITSILPNLTMYKVPKFDEKSIYIYLDELLKNFEEAFPHNRIIMIVETCMGGLGQPNYNEYKPYTLDLPQENLLPKRTGALSKSTECSPEYIMVHVLCHGRSLQQRGHVAIWPPEINIRTGSERVLRILEEHQQYYDKLLEFFSSLESDQLERELLRWRTDVKIPIIKGYSDDVARISEAVSKHFDFPFKFSLYSSDTTDVIFCAKEGCTIVGGVFSRHTMQLLMADLLTELKCATTTDKKRKRDHT